MSLYEFTILLDHLKWHPNIIVTTETWFSQDTCLDIPGCSGYHVCREDGRGGGVFICVKNYLVSCPVSESS